MLKKFDPNHTIYDYKACIKQGILTLTDKGYFCDVKVKFQPQETANF